MFYKSGRSVLHGRGVLSGERQDAALTTPGAAPALLLPIYGELGPDCGAVPAVRGRSELLFCAAWIPPSPSTGSARPRAPSIRPSSTVRSSTASPSARG